MSDFPLTLEKLTSLINSAKNNPLMREKARVEIKNMLRRVQRLCNAYIKEDVLDDYSEMLIDSNYDASQISHSCKECIKVGKLVPYSQFITFMPDKKTEVKKSDEYIVEAAKENKRFIALKEKFHRMYKEDKPEETFNRFLRLWLSLAFKIENIDELIKLGISPKLYERCALFDWEKYNFDINKLKQNASQLLMSVDQGES